MLKQNESAHNTDYLYHSLIDQNLNPRVSPETKIEIEIDTHFLYRLANIDSCVNAERLVGADYSSASNLTSCLWRKFGKGLTDSVKWRKVIAFTVMQNLNHGITWCLRILIKRLPKVNTHQSYILNN